MKPAVLFLCCALSFLAGIAASSLGVPFLYAAIPAALICAVLYAVGVDAFIGLIAAALLLAGAFYYAQDDARYNASISNAAGITNITGIIRGDPKHLSEYQSFVVDTPSGPFSVLANPFPEYAYGDQITLSGKSKSPDTSYEKGQHIVGDFAKPKITLVSKGNGNPILAFLYNLKRSVQTSYERYLPQDQSSLLFGVIFGANERFSKSFADNLELSGLRFITAIDGLHMQIVILIIFAVLSSMLSPRIAFAVTSACALGFVALTGFTISGIRAVLMAFIAGFAKNTGRAYLPLNALALIAVALSLINPKVMFYDVGFQLSFVAVLSILYFMPVLRHLLRFGEAPGLLAWKESLLITLSVQLATAPIVISQFQSFSLISFVASVFVVWLLPLIIGGGFFLAFAALWQPAGLIVAFLMHHILSYVTLVVNTAAKYAVLFNPELSALMVLAYYSILAALTLWFYMRPIATKEKTIPIIKTGYTIIEVE
jgi:competence protein ComEC